MKVVWITANKRIGGSIPIYWDYDCSRDSCDTLY